MLAMWDCCRSSPVEWCNRFVSFRLGYVALRILGCGGGVRSVPGIVDSVVGRRPHKGVRLGCLINQNSHVIRVPELCAAPRKHCNSNDVISTFEIHVGELRATFLRNHNMRRHKDPSRRQPKQKTAQAQQTEDPQAEDTPSPEDNPSGRQLKHRRPPQPRQPPQPPQARGHCMSSPGFCVGFFRPLSFVLLCVCFLLVAV